MECHETVLENGTKIFCWYERDKRGRLVRETDKKRYEKKYYYNDDNSLDKEEYYSWEKNKCIEKTRYTYDERGREIISSTYSLDDNDTWQCVIENFKYYELDCVIGCTINANGFSNWYMYYINDHHIYHVSESDKQKLRKAFNL